MFQLNLKIALRNIWKNKTASIINMFGLSMGLAGFITILLYLNFETSFDKWSPELKKVYKVGVHFDGNGSEQWWQTLPASFVDVIREKAPEIESASIVNWREPVIFHDQQFYYDIVASTVDSTFFRTFPFNFAQGDGKIAFQHPNSVIINKKTALKLFGTDQVLGKTLKLGFQKKDYTITAVLDNERSQSHFMPDIVTSIEMPKQEHWGNFGYLVYFKIKDGADVPATLTKLNRMFLDAKARWSAKNENVKIDHTGLLTEAESLEIMKKSGGSFMELIFEPVGKVYISSVFNGKSKETTIYVLSGLAVFLLIIAAINFTNLTIAHAGKRAREIGVKKVLGVERQSLVMQFLFETFIQTAFAFLVGLTLVELLLPYFNSVLGSSLSFLTGNHQSLFLQAIAVFVFVTLCAGIYPAVYFSGFMPVKVLKGNYERSAKGTMIRRVLIVTQFVITCTFIICFAVMFAQLKFMRNKDVGLQRDNVLSINLQTDQMKHIAADKFEQTRQRLKNIEGVKEVGLSSMSPWGGDGSSSGDASYLNTFIMMNDYYVDYDYFKTLNIPIKAGRNFELKTFQADTAGNRAVLNEAAVKALGIKDPVGKTYIRAGIKFDIIGVVKDFNDRGFESIIQPAHFIVNNNWMDYNNMVVNISPENPEKTRAAIEEVWKSIEPGFPVRMKWLDESFAVKIAAYKQQEVLMRIFSIATMGIALLGMFALATYNAKVRIREIAVRRVLGASTPGILKLLNKEFVVLVLVANIIAFVAAYILMSKWLNGFAYRIDVPFLLFALTGIVSLLLTVATVSWQAYKAAVSNPVDSLKYE